MCFMGWYVMFFVVNSGKFNTWCFRQVSARASSDIFTSVRLCRVATKQTPALYTTQPAYEGQEVGTERTPSCLGLSIFTTQHNCC